MSHEDLVTAESLQDSIPLEALLQEWSGLQCGNQMDLPSLLHTHDQSEEKWKNIIYQ